MSLHGKRQLRDTSNSVPQDSPGCMWGVTPTGRWTIQLPEVEDQDISRRKCLSYVRVGSFAVSNGTSKQCTGDTVTKHLPWPEETTVRLPECQPGLFLPLGTALVSTSTLGSSLTRARGSLVSGEGGTGLPGGRQRGSPGLWIGLKLEKGKSLTLNEIWSFEGV